MATTTVSLDDLRELAAFRAENGCAISLYLDLDPSIVPTAGDTATRVRSLLDAGAKSHGALVAVVGREQGRLLALRRGRLEEIADHTEEAPGRHDQGGWSQSRFQRHIENLDQEHYRTVGDELEKAFRRLGRPRIVVVGTEEVRAEFTDALTTELQEAIVGSVTAEARASTSDLQQTVLAPL